MGAKSSRMALPIDIPYGVAPSLQPDSETFTSSVEESVEKFKAHWSLLREFDSGEEVAEVSNVKLFRTLERTSSFSGFFKTFGEGEGSHGKLVVGPKFAKGAQAELYDVQIEWFRQEMSEQDLTSKIEHVLKVFKKGTFLRDLQAQWPQGMFQFHVDVLDRAERGLPNFPKFHSIVHGGTLLEDGRFAFLMVKELQDLRSLIDYGLSFEHMDLGPLSRTQTLYAMYGIALGMKVLHDRGIVHRDLKASNVLLSNDGAHYVVDYECSVGVVGIGFFRAREILQACKDGNVSTKVDLFTKAVDVYSYGMTCYEILSGKLPFEGHPLNDYDLVIKGGRPKVPEYVDGWICRLLDCCWHSNPSLRPSFGEILDTLTKNSPICCHSDFVIKKREIERGFRDSSFRYSTIVESLRELGMRLELTVHRMRMSWYFRHFQ